MRDYKPARHHVARSRTGSQILHRKRLGSESTAAFSRLVSSKIAVGFAVLSAIVVGLWLFISQLGPAVLPLQHPRSLVFVAADTRESPLYLVEYNPFNERIDVVPLDAATKVEVLGGYGGYSLGAIFPLLSLDKRSTEFVTATYTLALEHLVDGVVVGETARSVSSRGDLLRLLSSALFSRHHSGVSRIEIVRLWLFSMDAKTHVQVFSSGESPDEGTSDWQRLGQRCPIVLVNTTTTPRLAAAFEEVIRRSGLLVVRVTNESVEKANSEISFDDSIPDCSNVATRLRSMVPAVVVPQANKSLAQQYRGGVILFIGDDVEIDVTKKP